MNTLDFFIKKFNVAVNPKGGSEVRGINRTLMAETLGQMELNHGCEIGVAEGMHAEVLCRNNPNLDLTGVDAWKHYPGYQEYADLDDCYKQANERLSKYNVMLVKGFSADVVAGIPDGFFDFVYIDAAHDFKNVAMDICEWSKKVRVGGIVFGHDFKRSKRNVVDVKDVIPAYCYAKNIHPWFILTNDIKDPNFGHDNPGWLFIRQETDKL